MTKSELANELRKIYECGIRRQEQTTMIHLFGIKYANIIKR